MCDAMDKPGRKDPERRQCLDMPHQSRQSLARAGFDWEEQCEYTRIHNMEPWEADVWWGFPG
jgi:coproporphyrinogen III oxidase-like Fe-S oxidoreductase